MQASNLFFEMNDTVGFILRGMKLYYEPWQKSIKNILYLCEKQVRIYQMDVVWNNDITYYFPDDWSTYRMVLARYYAYKLGKILHGICELNGVSNCYLFHFRYIFMS